MEIGAAATSTGKSVFSLEELACYEAHRQEFVANSNGQYVLIKASAVIGIFPCEADTLKKGYESFGDTRFLVRKIAATDEVLNFSSMNVGL